MTQLFDPVAHADHFFGLLYKETEAATIQREREKALLAAAFIKACAQRDVNAPATYAPMVRDYSAPKAEGYTPHRYQTQSEVMVDSLDYSTGPTMADAMQILMDVAYSADTVNAPAKARALISRMAEAFAKYNHSEE